MESSSSRADSAQAKQQPEHYDGVAVSAGISSFEDLDDPTVLKHSMRALASSTGRNFVLDFGDQEAWVAFDLTVDAIQSFLKTDRPAALNTRWINIWYPYHHRALLELLGQTYDFSPRLLALMCSDPYRRKSTSLKRPRSSVSSRKKTRLRRSHPDPEKEAGFELEEVSSSASNNPARTGNLYDIVEDVWHYTSVDQGRNYLCLGYNSIYYLGPLKSVGTVKSPLPDCKRVWTWLLLLADRTVITINEDPYPHSESRLNHVEDMILRDTRRNLINVFRSLSHVDEDHSLGPLSLLPIRRRLGQTDEETAHRASDAPGLLFYYLFENWFNSYSLITRQDSRYGTELEQVRKEMFDRPQLCHIDQLDRIGNQLGALKRHYESHLRIIDRVLEPQKASNASLANSRIASKASKESFDSDGAPKVPESESLLGVSLSSAARVRFERLKDIINLYSLSEVKDYLHEKDSLVQMNFQLISIRTSNFSERLTGVALLISKVTVLFLPVSFMSAYFSTSLKDTEYTVSTYWITFTIVFALSCIVLVLFGLVSGTMESKYYIQPVKNLFNHLCQRRKHSDTAVEDDA